LNVIRESNGQKRDAKFLRKQKRAGERRRTAGGSPTLPRTRSRADCRRRGDPPSLKLRTDKRVIPAPKGTLWVWGYRVYKKSDSSRFFWRGNFWPGNRISKGSLWDRQKPPKGGPIAGEASLISRIIISQPSFYITEIFIDLFIGNFKILINIFRLRELFLKFFAILVPQIL